MNAHRGELLDAVGRVLREDDEVLALLLERLAAGDANEEERTELERRAAASHEVRLLIDACAPERTRSSTASAAAAVREQAPDVAGVVVPLRRRPETRASGGMRAWGVRAWGATAALAAAAAVAVALVWPKAPVLPPYSLELSIHSREFRDGGDAALQASVEVIHPGDVIEIVLRPERESAEPVKGAVWAITGGPPTYLARMEPRGTHGVLAVQVAASALPAQAAGASPIELVAVAAPAGVWSEGEGREHASAAAVSEPWIRESHRVLIAPP